MIVSNFLKRAISGLLFVVVLTGCIFIHPICFYILFFIINILGLMEFSRMAKHMNIHVNLFFCILCGSVLFTVGFLHNYINYKDGYLYFFLLTFIMSICELYRKRGNGFQNIAFSYYALLYISLPFTLLIYLPYMTSGNGCRKSSFSRSYSCGLTIPSLTFPVHYSGNINFSPEYLPRNRGKEPSAGD